MVFLMVFDGFFRHKKGPQKNRKKHYIMTARHTHTRAAVLVCHCMCSMCTHVYIHKYAYRYTCITMNKFEQMDK